MKQEFVKSLKRRITNLSKKEIDRNQDAWSIGFDTGYKQACLQILDMIKNYE